MHIISGVEPGGIAEQLGILPGDALISINGERPMDWVDYQALVSAEKISMLVTRAGETIEYEFEKDDYEPLGLRFETDMLGGVRACANKCVFCFVDQLPPGARESMRVKDDDWRLSLMMGNYVTLTNVGDAELERIIKRRASPLYISVHATEPELRTKLLGSQNAGKLMEQLNALARGGIRFHAQAVLCPGLNDGDALERTITELSDMYPACQSLALVPVGLTAHREGLTQLKPYTRLEAKAVLDIADKHSKRMLRDADTRFVFPADEFYLAAGEDFPPDSAYEDYAQIDDGVGMARQLITEFEDAYLELPAKLRKPGMPRKTLVIASGVSAQPFIKRLIDEHPIAGVRVSVVAVKNRYFGETVTVSGLVTGEDLINALKNREADAYLITECMLRAEGDRFLDDVTLADARKRLARPLIPVRRRGEDLLEAILKYASA